VLQANVRDNVRRGSKVYTDELLSYDGLNADYVHNVIDHAERYVDGQIHTNGRELLEPLEARPEGHLRERRTVPFIPLP
jgi:hypothetical protein